MLIKTDFSFSSSSFTVHPYQCLPIRTLILMTHTAIKGLALDYSVFKVVSVVVVVVTVVAVVCAIKHTPLCALKKSEKSEKWEEDEKKGKKSDQGQSRKD